MKTRGRRFPVSSCRKRKFGYLRKTAFQIIFFVCVLIFFSSHADELEPVGTTILLEEEFLAVGEAAGFAALAFGRVGAVEVRYVLVADVAEPGCGWEES